MLIFLYGQDAFRASQKLNEIIEHYKKIHKSGLNLKSIDLTEGDFQEFKNDARTISMFQEKKLIVLRNTSQNKIFQEAFLENKNNYTNSDDIFVFIEEEIPGNNKFFNFLKRNAKAQEFKILEGAQLKNWVKKEFNKYGAKTDNDSLQKLIEFVGNDLWRMENEIKKLVSFKKSKIIERKDIENLISPQIETDIFETIDAISSRNKKMALELLHRHIEKGDSPLYLLSMINFQFRNLLIIKDLLEKGRPYYTFQKTTQLHPFVIRKAMTRRENLAFRS